MAEVTPTITPISQTGGRLVTWALSPNNPDNGVGVFVGAATDVAFTVNITAAFSIGTLTWQGSHDNSTWATLNNKAGSAVIATYTGSFAGMLLWGTTGSMPLYIRPSTTGGAASSACTAILHIKDRQ